MRQKGGSEVARIDSAPVVADAYQIFAAPLDCDGNIFCARIDAVFDKFFDDGIRPVDDLASRNPIIDTTV